MIELDPRIKAWTDGVEIEASALQQLRNVASLSIVGPHIAVMPDVIGILHETMHDLPEEAYTCEGQALQFNECLDRTYVRYELSHEEGDRVVILNDHTDADFLEIARKV